MWHLSLFIALILANQLSASCDVCETASNVACHNETSFSICMHGIPTYNYINCPLNSFCTDGIYTCYTNTEPICKVEKEPQTTPTSSTTNESTPTTLDLTSTTDETTTKESTTTTTITTVTPKPSTTTSAPWSAEATCLSATESGNFKNEDDPTCKTYIYCYRSNNTFTPKVQNCKSSKPYYDAATRSCVLSKPTDCTE